MIRVERLTKEYGDNQALRSVSFEVAAGQICGYLGPNGAGKTTTVRILTGMMPPTAGTATVAGFDVARDALEVKRRIGYVPENANIYQTLTVNEYLALVGALHQIPPATIAERVAKMLDLFEISQAANHRIDTLSKGMRQKVLITGALIHDPEVLLFDEPLSGLDANATQTVKEIVKEMAHRGRTVFYCSHLLDIVERLCDRVIILNGGSIVADDTPANLIKQQRAKSLEEVFRTLTGHMNQQQVARGFADALQPKTNN